MSEAKHTPEPYADWPFWRLALYRFGFYALDMGCAVAGFVYGFGLSIKSWGAVLGFMIFSRFVTFCITGMLDRAAKRAAIAKALGASQGEPTSPT